MGKDAPSKRPNPVAERLIAPPEAGQPVERVPRLQYTLDQHGQPIERRSPRQHRIAKGVGIGLLALSAASWGLALWSGDWVASDVTFALLEGITGSALLLYHRIGKAAPGPERHFLTVEEGRVAFNFGLLNAHHDYRADELSRIELRLEQVILHFHDAREPAKLPLAFADHLRYEVKNAFRHFAGFHQIPVDDSGHHLRLLVPPPR